MKLAYGIFYSNDIQAVKEFYEKKIGLEATFSDDNFVAFKVGDALLGVKKASDARENPGKQTVIVSVPNVEDLYSRLTEIGVNICKELSLESWGKNFAILDPDGNKVEFTEQ